MKKIYNYMMLAAVAAAALVSCAKEMAPVLSNENEGIRVTLVAGETATKTEIDGTTSYWKDGDAVGVFAADSKTLLEFPETSIASGRATTATFAGTVPAAGDFYAIYPYAVTVQSDSKLISEIPAIQYPTSNSSFDRNADLLISQKFTVESTTPSVNDLVFKRLCGVLKVNLIDGTGSLSTENVLKVSVTSSAQALAGAVLVDAVNSSVALRGNGSKVVSAYFPTPFFTVADGNTTFLTINPVTLHEGETVTVDVVTDNFNITKTVNLTSDIVVKAGQILPINITITNDEKAARTSRKVETVWIKRSTGTTAWNAYYGGTGNTDRNVAMDDDFIYIAETNATKNLWAISITDPSDVRKLPTETVVTEGQTFALACPRVLKNTDPAVNNGKDVLIVCSMSMSGSYDPYLYVYNNGIENEPQKVKLVTSGASGDRIGDTFTVSGTYQNAKLFFCKANSTAASSGGGIVSFTFNGTSLGSTLTLMNRLKIDNPGVSAYYPYPEDITKGIYAKRDEARAQEATVSATSDNIWNGWSAYDVALNGGGYHVVKVNDAGFNFIEYRGVRYVIYQQYNTSSAGYVRILGSTDSSKSWYGIVEAFDDTNIGRRDLARVDGSLVSGHNGMDVAVREINGELYIAAVKQNIALSLTRIRY